MKTIIIIVAAVVILAFVVYVLTKVSDIEREHQKMQDNYQRACERHRQHEEEHEDEEDGSGDLQADLLYGADPDIGGGRGAVHRRGVSLLRAVVGEQL